MWFMFVACEVKKGPQIESFFDQKAPVPGEHDVSPPHIREWAHTYFALMSILKGKHHTMPSSTTVGMVVQVQFLAKLFPAVRYEFYKLSDLCRKSMHINT
eukprot:4046330-Amphidinium_carterae.2